MPEVFLLPPNPEVTEYLKQVIRQICASTGLPPEIFTETEQRTATEMRIKRNEYMKRLQDA